MRNVIFSCLIFFTFFIVPKVSFSYNMCLKPEVLVDIDNLIKEERISYGNTKSLSELSEMSKRKGGYTLGLFVFDIISKASIEVENSPKTGCPTKMTMKIEIDFNPNIYVASEYPKGTSEYDYILAHEKEHVRITVENNEKYLSRLKKEIYDYAMAISMGRPQNEEEMVEAVKQIIASMKVAISHYVQGLNSFIETQHNNFDAKEEKKDYFKGYFF